MCFWNHMSAWQIRKRLEPDLWAGMFKITSERHPYEKAVSSAYQRYVNHHKSGRFTDYLERVVQSGSYRNFDLYTMDGKIIADFVILYETLQHDVQALLRGLSLPTDATLPTAKTQFRQDHRPARDILSHRQKSMIRYRCAEEFEAFGYDP